MLLWHNFFVSLPAFPFFFLVHLPVLGLLNTLQLFHIYIYVCVCVYFPCVYVACEYFLFCHELCFVIFALLWHVFRPFWDSENFRKRIFCPLMNSLPFYRLGLRGMTFLRLKNLAALVFS